MSITNKKLGKLKLVVVRMPDFDTHGVYLQWGDATLFNRHTGRGKYIHYEVLGKCFKSRIISIPTVAGMVSAAKDKWASISPFKQYYWYSATDCDSTHVEYAVVYQNGRRATESIAMAYDSAEGATSFTKLTKAEYEAVKNQYTGYNQNEIDAGY